MSYDGSVKFDTKIDTTGLKRDAKTLTSTFASIRDVMMGPIAAGKMIIDVFKKIGQVADQLENAWAAQEEAIALLDATLKSTGADAWTSSKRLQEMASSLQQVTKFGDETITSMQTVLLGFRNITGENFEKATVEILNMATVMKMDLTSAAQAVGKALDNPAQGMDSLSRQGFKFTQQEKEMMKAMQDAGDLAGAQKIILDELAKTYGGAAEAAGATGSAMKVKLQNAVGDLNEELGKLVSEALAPARSWMLALTQSVTAQVTAFSNASAAAKEYGATILSFTGQKMLEGIGAPTTKPAATTFEQMAIVAQNKLSAEQTVNSTRTLESLQKQLVALNALLAMEKDITAEERAAYALKKADVESLIVVRNDQLRLETEYLNTEYAVTQNEIKALQEKIAYYESFTKSTGEEARKRDIVLENLREQLRVLQDIKDAEVEVIGGIEAASGSGVVKGLGASMLSIAAPTKEAIGWLDAYDQEIQGFITGGLKGLTEGFFDLADAMNQSLATNDFSTFISSFRDMVEQFHAEMPKMLAMAGLQAIIGGNMPLGIALLAAGGITLVGAGLTALTKWLNETIFGTGDALGGMEFGGELDKIGQSIGSKLADSLFQGFLGEDFAYEVEEFIRKGLIEGVVNSAAIQAALGKVNAMIADGIQEGELQGIAGIISDVYSSASSQAALIDSLITGALTGDLSQNVSLSSDMSKSMTANVNLTANSNVSIDGETVARAVTKYQDRVYSNAYGA